MTQENSRSLVEIQDPASPPSGSVVVIVKNGKNSIRRCLNSLMAQTATCEIVVVDGNSTDGTREIVGEYPVKVIISPQRDSYGVSRNIGVKNSEGEVVLFMDADDYAEPNWAKTLLSHFEKSDRPGIVTVPRRVDAFRGWFMKMLSYEYSTSSAQKSEQAQSWGSVTTKGTAWLKRAIVDAGWFDEAMYFGTEDKDLSCRISRLGYSVELEPSAPIWVSPVGGARNFLKDKFWRAGVGHGYLRRKLGVYRPPLSGILSMILLLAGLTLLIPLRETILAVCAFLLAIFTLASVLREGISLHSEGAPFVSTIAFVAVKWLSRVLEFLGFSVGYFWYPYLKGRRGRGPR